MTTHERSTMAKKDIVVKTMRLPRELDDRINAARAAAEERVGVKASVDGYLQFLLKRGLDYVEQEQAR